MDAVQAFFGCCRTDPEFFDVFPTRFTATAVIFPAIDRFFILNHISPLSLIISGPCTAVAAGLPPGFHESPTAYHKL
jgi:hypothetical protein